jgi:ribonuclease BN (tRNA processing enzyme)
MKRATLAMFGVMLAGLAQAQGCPEYGIAAQVLGSGGKDIRDWRAAGGVLLWSQGKPRVLVNAGPGVAFRFIESGANPADLDVVLLSRLDIGSSADLATLVEAAWYRARERILPVYGPRGNNTMPSTVSFVRTLFDPVRGAYRYRGELLTPLDRGAFKLRPYDVPLKPGRLGSVFRSDRLAISALAGTENGVPELAWRVELDGKTVVFAGEVRDRDPALVKLARAADLLVAHEPDPGASGGAESPAVTAVGTLAREAKVRGVLLAHRRVAGAGREDQLQAAIARTFDGPVSFAADLDCHAP